MAKIVFPSSPIVRSWWSHNFVFLPVLGFGWCCHIQFHDLRLPHCGVQLGYRVYQGLGLHLRKLSNRFYWGHLSALLLQVISRTGCYVAHAKTKTTIVQIHGKIFYYSKHWSCYSHDENAHCNAVDATLKRNVVTGYGVYCRQQRTRRRQPSFCERRCWPPPGRTPRSWSSRLHPVVNFTNILRTAFVPIFLWQKITIINSKDRKASKNTFV